MRKLLFGMILISLAIQLLACSATKPETGASIRSVKVVESIN